MSHSDFKMDPKMTMGPVTLRVRDLDSMLRFYKEDLGLDTISEHDETTELAPNKCHEALIILKSDPSAKTPPAGSAELYHCAILVPSRVNLAEAYLALGNVGVTFDGYADHVVSEALYLTDPEGNGIEIYADRPRNEWKFDDDRAPHMGTYPLDIDSLLREVKKPTDNLKAVSEKVRIGHVHLKVTDLKRSIFFYHNQLGLDLMNYWGSAAFLSAGGYHHHIGINTWESLTGSPFNNGCVGLEYFTIHLSNKNAATQLYSSLKVTSERSVFIYDPDGIKILPSASQT